MFILLILLAIIFLIIFSLQPDEVKEIEKIRDNIDKLEEDTDHNQEYFSNFPKYYINLDRSPDRKKIIEDLMDLYNIKNYKRVRAYDYKEKNSFTMGDHHIYDSPIEIAITMSHIRAMVEALKTNDLAVIMEDDNRFSAIGKWDFDFREIVKMIPEDCEILLLCTCTIEKKQQIKLINYYRGKAIGNCYIVTQKAKKKLEKIYNNGDFRFDLIDEKKVTFDMEFMHFMKTYYLTQSLFIPENYQTDGTYKKDLKLHYPSKKISEYYVSLDNPVNSINH